MSYAQTKEKKEFQYSIGCCLCAPTVRGGYQPPLFCLLVCCTMLAEATDTLGPAVGYSC